MKLAELKKMKTGDNVQHKRYGLCSIDEIRYSFGSLFGILVSPKTPRGKTLLALDCGVPDIPLMEANLRNIKPGGEKDDG